MSVTPQGQRCGCFCTACDKFADHRNCQNVTPCKAQCGCPCGACRLDDHVNCSHVNPCPKKDAPVPLAR